MYAIQRVSTGRILRYVKTAQHKVPGACWCAGYLFKEQDISGDGGWKGRKYYHYNLELNKGPYCVVVISDKEHNSNDDLHKQSMDELLHGCGTNTKRIIMDGEIVLICNGLVKHGM